MSSRFQEWVAEFTRKPRKLFQLDGAGALLTAFMVGGVLVSVDHWIGLPRAVLFSLGGIALAFAIYSFTCSRFELKSIRLALGLIILGNSFYCALTMCLMILFRTDLTPWGYAYFLLELGVLFTLIALESAVFRKIR